MNLLASRGSLAAALITLQALMRRLESATSAANVNLDAIEELHADGRLRTLLENTVAELRGGGVDVH